MSPQTSALAEALVRQFLSRPEENRIVPSGSPLASPLVNESDFAGERAWDEPLVGFARGDDPMFASYKEHVGPFHWTPAEALRLARPDLSFGDAQVAVMAWILPQTEAVRADHRREKQMPSRRWCLTRKHGEAINARLRRHVVAGLEAAGIPAAAPVQISEWSRVEGGKFVYASTWSERHAAHACGLGTFGLCDGLITPVGKSIRVGSVVALADWDATPRPYTSHREWCLFFATGKCGACIRRCPTGALSESGHDKPRCKAYIRGVTSPHAEARLVGFAVNACGLCQTGVPCEKGIPKVLLKGMGGRS